MPSVQTHDERRKNDAVKVFYDEAQLRHTPQFFLQRGVVRPNFEVPTRATALLEGVRSLGLEPESPPGVPDVALGTVHTHAYLAFLQRAAAEWAALPGAGPEAVPNLHPSPEMLAQGAQPGATILGQLGYYTADTACPIGPHTWQSARAAAACALAAAEAIAGGAAASGRHAYALCRPPGHHAYPARAGGHCYLNNAALAAQRLRDRGAARVAVLDIDSHHGNGTQGAFYDRGDVLTVSLHGDPAGYYPWYVGTASERGIGPGEGRNLNLPLPRGTADAAWLEALRTALDALTRFGPEALVLSLGFDASEHEPLGFLAVTNEGFSRAAEAIAAFGRPTAIIQEGGYNVDALPGLVAGVLPAFL